ncbi:MAG: cell wall-active antibiotics response protein [Bacillota bacterium]
MRSAFWGLALLLAGLLLLAANLGHIPEFNVWGLWPILVMWPAAKLAFGRLFVTVRSPSRPLRVRIGRSLGVRLVALWVLAGATAQLLFNLSLSSYTWGDVSYWTLPLLLIGLGALLLFRPRRRVWRWSEWVENGRSGRARTWPSAEEPPGEPSNISSFVGDLRFGSRPWVFKSPMNIQLWAGDIDLDLTTAEFAPGDNYLTIRAWAGDLDVRAPRDMEVIVEAHCGAGDMRIFDEHRSGMDLNIRVRRRPEGRAGDDSTPSGDADSRGRLFIGIDMSFGEVRVG